MDALGKRKNTQQVSINNMNHISDTKVHINNDNRRFKKRLRHTQNSGSSYEDKQSKKVDWQSVSPFFKRIISKPSVETWGSGLRVLDQALDPLWANADKECVNKNEYAQIVQYMQNKCNIYDLGLSRPDEKHDNFITKITDEIVAVSMRPKSESGSDARALKILINFGNSAAWAIFDRIESTNSMKLDEFDRSNINITSYVSLSSSEYEYLYSLFRYIAVVGNGEFKSHIPIIGRFGEKRDVNIDNSVDGNPDESDDSVNLGGFTWKTPPSDSYQVIYEEMLKKYSLDGLLHYSSEIPNLGKSESFTGQQIISTLYELMAIESELQDMKSNILSQLCIENKYPYKLAHEPRVGQLITVKARASQRWSQFRRIFTSAINHYSKQMREEKTEVVKTNETVLSEEYCSVCLMSEQAHKHVLIQCRRCRIRVHHQCYVSIGTPPLTDSSTWLCDVCVDEGGRGETHVANRAICVICGSSGGALKKVDGDVAMYFTQAYTAQCNRLYGDGRNSSVSWIHVICGVWLIPTVNCRDWASLSSWDISNLRTTTKSNRCAICMASLGFYITCKVSQCGVKMHPLCAWLGGMYASVRFIYSKSLPFNSASDCCFTAFQIDTLCPFHSCKEYTQMVVKFQAKERSRAYLHYVMNPNPFNKQRQPAKALVLSPSPIMITINGPVASPSLIMQESMSMYPMHGSILPLRGSRGRIVLMPPRVDHSMSYREFMASQQALQPKPINNNVPIGFKFINPSQIINSSKGRIALLHLDNLKPNICSICYENINDVILQCKRCMVNVHRRCYFNDVNIDIPEFLCICCRIGIESPECYICKCKGGALSLITNNDRLNQPTFTHFCCAIFAGLAITTDNYTGLNHFCGLSRNFDGEGGDLCSICDTSTGLLVCCNQQGCTNHLHISCGKRSGCYIEIKHTGHYALCIQHTQNRESISPRLRMYLKLLAFVEIANIALDITS